MKKFFVFVLLLLSSDTFAQQFLGINGYHYGDTLRFNGVDFAIGLELLGSGQGSLYFATQYTNPAFEGTIGNRTIGSPGWNPFGITYRTPSGAAVDTGSVYVSAGGNTVMLALIGYPPAQSSVASYARARVEVVQRTDGNSVLITERIADGTAELFASDGRRLSTVQLQRNRHALDELSAQGLVPGMYFVRVTGRTMAENRNRSWYVKMVKMR